MLNKINNIKQQIRQMEKRTLIIGICVVAAGLLILLYPSLALAQYDRSLQALSQQEGYDDVQE